MKLLQRMHAFLSKVHSPIYAAVHAVTLSKKHQRSSTVQEEGPTNEGRHNLLLLHRLTMCEVAVFSKEISELSKIHPPPFLRSHLSSLLMAYVQQITVLYNRFITMISQAVEVVLKMFLDLNAFFIQNY